MVRTRKVNPAFLVSLAGHAVLVGILLAVTRPNLGRQRNTPATTNRHEVSLIWLAHAGPASGGGGSGNGMAEPPRTAERRGTDPRTVPVAKAPAEASTRPADADPIQGLSIPVVTLASGVEMLPGAIETPTVGPTLSQGPGSGGNAGTGVGTGDGPGRGSGLGDGLEAGTGGDVYRPGAEVTVPVEIRRGSPRYTVEAMRARAQGIVTIQCVVRPTGECTDIRVTRSFKPPYGLDEEAVRAAAQWRFRPGMRRGQPVPVLVTMEIAFALR